MRGKDTFWLGIGCVCVFGSRLFVVNSTVMMLWPFECGCVAVCRVWIRGVDALAVWIRRCVVSGLVFDVPVLMFVRCCGFRVQPLCIFLCFDSDCRFIIGENFFGRICVVWFRVLDSVVQAVIYSLRFEARVCYEEAKKSYQIGISCNKTCWIDIHPGLCSTGCFLDIVGPFLTLW